LSPRGIPSDLLQGVRWIARRRVEGKVMVAAIDIYRTANILVQQYGPENAVRMAAKRCDALLELGDVNGQRVWKAVLRAVEELVRVERRAGERVN
jgi:hypothetical protein